MNSLSPFLSLSLSPSSSFYLQVDALIQLVKHFGWTWVGVIAGDDAYGRGGASIFAEEVGHAPINKKIPFCILL